MTRRTSATRPPAKGKTTKRIDVRLIRVSFPKPGDMIELDYPKHLPIPRKGDSLQLHPAFTGRDETIDVRVFSEPEFRIYSDNMTEIIINTEPE